MNPETHDKFRGRKGSWERAPRFRDGTKVGICLIKYKVGRYNAHPEDVKLLDYSKQKYTTLLNVATPGGMWAKIPKLC